MTRGTRDIPGGLKKDWKPLAKAMQDAEWTFEQGSKHIMAFAPIPPTYQRLPKTPSDRRALQNEISKFRRWCREHGADPGI